MHGVTFRPIANDWPLDERGSRRASQFKADYQTTCSALRHEIRQLSGSNIVVQIDLTENEIRLDGQPRAKANPQTPRVIVSFDSKHGPLRYLTDEFSDWESNLRAIALGLEALRKVDRYGISRRGEQYTGWRQIEAPSMSDLAASQILAGAAGVSVERMRHLGDTKTYRLALKRSHPDQGGTPEAFHSVTEAGKVLGL